MLSLQGKCARELEIALGEQRLAREIELNKVRQCESVNEMLNLTLHLTLTLSLQQTQKREECLEYELLQNKQHVSDLQDGFKQATADHNVALHECKKKLRSFFPRCLAHTPRP